MRLPDPLVVTPDKQLEQVSPWGVQRNFEAIQQRFPLGPDDLHFGGTVTALPTGVDEGFEVNYVASSSAGVVWRLKYLPTTSATYPWLCIGGPWLESGPAGDITTATNTRGTAMTSGPSLTVPLAGDYDLGLSCQFGQSADGVNNMIAEVKDATPTYYLTLTLINGGTPGTVRPGAKLGPYWERVNVASASTALSVGVYSANSVSTRFVGATIFARPVRVA